MQCSGSVIMHNKSVCISIDSKHLKYILPNNHASQKQHNITMAKVDLEMQTRTDIVIDMQITNTAFPDD